MLRWFPSPQTRPCVLERGGRREGGRKGGREGEREGTANQPDKTLTRKRMHKKGRG
jgi:hypothetical protein